MASEIRDSQVVRLTPIDVDGQVRATQVARLTPIDVDGQIHDSQVVRMAVVEVPENIQDSQVVRLVVVEMPPEVEFAGGGEVDTGLTWVEVTDRQGAVRVHSKVALSDRSTYYHGFKDDRVTQWGRLSRALSDRLGQYEAATFDWFQADTDRLYRGLADGAFTKAIKNRPATVRMIDDPSRRLQLTPRTMMKGIVRAYSPEHPLLWRFTIHDVLASRFSSENTKDQLPARLVGRGDFENCPAEVVGLPVPIIYGDLRHAVSTEGPPTIIGTAAEGAYNSDGWHAAFGAQVSDAAVPTGVAVALAGGGTLSPDVPNGEYGVIVTAVDASGQESAPQEFYYNGPGDGRGSFAFGPLSPTYTEEPDGTEKIAVSWSASAGAVKYRVYLGTYYYGANFHQFIEVNAPTTSVEFTKNPAFGTSTSPSNITPGASNAIFSQRWMYAVSAVMLDGETATSELVVGRSHPYRRPVKIEWEAVTGALGYKVYRRGMVPGPWLQFWSVPSSQTFFEDDMLDTGATVIDPATIVSGGQVPVIPVGLVADTSGFKWQAFMVCGHAVKEITDVYQDGKLVPSGNFGVTWAVPGKPGFTTYFANTGPCPFVDINGNRYTLIYVRGPEGDWAANGERTITLNVKGVETVGDSSGDLIVDGLDQYRHAWKNWIIQTYRTGAWLDAPTFADDGSLSQLDSDSFDAAKAVAQSRLAGGYVGAWMLGAAGERVTIRDLIARLNVSFDVDSGFNRKTQFFVSMVDDSISALSAGGRVNDVRDIHEGSFRLIPMDADHFNVIPYAYSRDYTGARETGWNAESEERSQEAIDDIEEEKPSPKIELHCVRNAVQALDVINRRLLRSKDMPFLVTWKQGMSGLSIEVGSIQRVTAYDAIGGQGYVDRPIRIVRHEVDPNGFEVTLEGVDMERIFSGAFILGDRDTLSADWTSASTAERSYGYLADRTTGRFSDDAPGKRLR